MAPTILIKFCGLIDHSKPNNVVLSAFPGRILVNRKIFFFIFYPSPNVAPKPTDQCSSNSIFRVACNCLQPVLFIFYLPLILRVVRIRNKKRNEKHGILQT